MRDDGPDGKWMRTEGNKRKTIEEGEESLLSRTVKLRRTVKYPKTLDRTGRSGVGGGASERGG